MKRLNIKTNADIKDWNKSGIYCIVNTSNNYLYLGSTKNFWNRWREHYYQLRKGTHHSSYLQNSWNKYKESNFEFRILEICDKKELLDLEDMYLLSLECHYNHLDKATSHLGYKYGKKFKDNCSKAQKKVQLEKRKGLRPWHTNSKNFVVVNPKGEKEFIYNLYEYCRINNLDSSKMVKIAKGKKQWEKGYQCFYPGEEYKALPITEYKQKKGNTGKSKKCVLYSPDQKVKYEVENLSSFCRKHNLNRSLMSKVCRGQQSHHKQWTGKYI